MMLQKQNPGDPDWRIPHMASPLPNAVLHVSKKEKELLPPAAPYTQKYVERMI